MAGFKPLLILCYPRTLPQRVQNTQAFHFFFFFVVVAILILSSILLINERNHCTEILLKVDVQGISEKNSSDRQLRYTYLGI